MQNVTPPYLAALPTAPQRIARFAVLALFALSGCSTASYPSLARRDAETLRQAAVAAPAPKPAAPDARIAPLLDAARAADARFTQALPRAQAALNAAQGAKPGDDLWSAANMALSALDRARGDLGVVLGDLDAIYAQSRMAPGRDTALALAAAQDARLGELRAQLPR